MSLYQSAPSDLVLRTILKCGGAFSHEYSFFGEAPKRRLFFVVNHDPTNDARIVLLTTTTQTKKRESHHGERAKSALVYIAKDEYAELTEDSVIDCDCHFVRRKREDFLRDVEDRKYEPKSSLPPDVMDRIRAAIASAKKLSMVEKRVILGSNP